MDPQSPPLVAPRADIGVTDSIRSLLASGIAWMDARLRLARLEGSEALRLGLGIAALALFVLTSLFIAYLSVILALGLWIAQVWWQGSVIPAALIVAMGHLALAAAGAVWMIHASRGCHLFQATLIEFTEDRRWLHTHQKSRN